LATLTGAVALEVILFSTITVSALSDRWAAKIDSSSGLPVVAETLVSPNWLPLPS
jgi:hypothetical protein